MNTNLHLAKKAKNDEFYTKLSDIENEIQQYISRGFEPDLVILDYFECLKPKKNNDGFNGHKKVLS